MRKHREFTCIICGKKSIDRSPSGTKKYCSHECYYASFYQRTCGNKQRCRFNKGVQCAAHECIDCGWNPQVEQRRKEAFV